MKKLLSFFLFISSFAQAQVTPDPTIKGNTNTLIRNAEVVTRSNHALVNDQLTNSKMSRVESWTANGTNTYTASVTWVTAYTSGLSVPIKFTNANTGAATININSLGTKAIKINGSSALEGGEINAGQAFDLYYDGTNFQLKGGGGSSGGGSWGEIEGIISDQTDLQDSLSSKQSHLNGTGFVKASGTSISYDNSTYTPTSTSINTTSPLSGGGDLSTDRTLSISNAAADGSTKGAASFTANDFDAASGNVSIDYTNGQTANGSNKGYLSSTDWTTFNNKQTALSGTGYSKFSGSSVSYNVTIPNADLTNSTISGVSLGSNLANLSIGAELISGGATTYNGASAKTLAIQAASVTNSMLAGSISNSNLTNSSITIAGNSTALGGAVTLDNITGLSSTGLVKRTGSNTLAIATPGADYLTGNQTITISGDVSGSGSTSITGTLATVNSNIGTFGSATKSTTVTANGKGLITAISEQTVTPAVGSITGLGSNVSTFLATPSSANLASALTDETGTGATVFGTSPTVTTPVVISTANNQTSNYTFALTDIGKIVKMSLTSSNNLTIPNDATVNFPLYTTLSAVQDSTGTTTLVAASGVYFKNASGTLTFAKKNAGLSAWKYAANKWFIFNTTNQLSNPMTTLGDILYEGATPAPQRLAGNTTTTPKYLRQVGTGSVSAAPSWENVNGSEVQGYADNTAVVAGYLGETISSAIAVGSATSLTTATAKNITSIILTPGTWIVTGNVNFTESSATVTARSWSLSTTSATLKTDGTEVNNDTGTTTTTQKIGGQCTPLLVLVAAATTTTVYLVGKATFSAGTNAGYGSLMGTRTR